VNAWMIAEIIRWSEERGEMRRAMEGIGERRRRRVRSSRGVARWRFVYIARRVEVPKGLEELEELEGPA
jgi:hypothetical protein